MAGNRKVSDTWNVLSLLKQYIMESYKGHKNGKINL